MDTVRTMVLLFLAGLYCGIRAAEPPALTAEQYTRAENLYWKVTARCCLRKPGALKVHQDIEAMIAKGRSDREILAVLASRLGGLRQVLPDDPPPKEARWGFAAAGGVVLLIAGIVIRCRRFGAALSKT
jgi:hypothetical protein